MACEGNARDLGHNSLIVIDIYNYYAVWMSAGTTSARTVKRELGPGSVIADIGVRDPWRHRLCSSPPCAWMTGTRSWRQETRKSALGVWDAYGKSSYPTDMLGELNRRKN